MKKYISLVIVLAFSVLTGTAGMSNSIDYTQLYIVGDATQTSWDLGKAESFGKISEGVFEWTGQLEGNKEFKFMNDRSGWHKHIVALEGGLTLSIGDECALNFFANWSLDGKLDCKMRVAETAIYTITVDLLSMRMRISEPVALVEWPEKLYLYGSATDFKAIEIPNAYGVERKKTLTLKPGFAKLMDTPTVTAETKYFVPRFPEVDITFGKGYMSNIYPETNKDARGWSVMVAGDYSFYLDNSRKTFACKKYKPYTILYIVGGCCEKAWDYSDAFNNKFRQDPDNAEIMVWEGELRIGWDKKINGDGSVSLPDEPNKFKILTAPDWFKDTFHPYISDISAEGTSDARISGGDDLKWTISRDGFYRLELNTKTETLKGVYTPLPQQAHKPSTEMGGVVDVEIQEEKGFEEYYNLQGIKIEKPDSGVFIVYDGHKAIKKIK